MNESIQRIMYLAAQKLESGKVIRGGFLLTDTDTKPIEFRCTNPIRPTQLQTVLYGDILERHISVELIGVPLVQSVKERPDVILVVDPNFLHLRGKTEIPVVLVTREEKLVGIDGHENEFLMLTSTSGHFEPIVLSTHGEFPADKAETRELLGEIFNKHNLLEPFDRISSALEQVHTQRIGESQAQ